MTKEESVNFYIYICIGLTFSLDPSLHRWQISSCSPDPEVPGSQARLEITVVIKEEFCRSAIIQTVTIFLPYQADIIMLINHLIFRINTKVIRTTYVSGVCISGKFCTRKHKVERKPICLIPFQGSLLNEAVHQLVNAEFLSAKKRLQNQKHHT